MIKTIQSVDIKLGMFVILPASWFSHPFVTSSFYIKSTQDIDRIIAYGIKEITTDTSKSLARDEIESVAHNPATRFPDSPNLSKINISDDGIDKIINQKYVDSKKRSEAVYVKSVEIMKNLFKSPTAEVIQKGKVEISRIVDLILNDEETPGHLLRIMSHDFYTYTHSVNVGVLSIALCKRLFKTTRSQHDMHELGAGFFLHDLGKVKVDPAIINKPAKLTEFEMKKMKTHPYQSYKILKETNQLSEEAMVITMQHHEREDGTGYPRKLKGDEIHPYGRIGCIADVYDALTATRSYKRSFTPFEALTIMKEEMLGHFHKDIFENFVHLF